MTTSFAADYHRAGDHPNAFALARRMAEAMSKSPKEEKGGWKYVIDSPPNVDNLGLATQLLTIAIQHVQDERYRTCGVVSTYSPASGGHPEINTLHIELPRLDASSSIPVLPTQQIAHKLKTIQDALSTNWVKDAKGCYRHTVTFMKFEHKMTKETELNSTLLFKTLLERMGQDTSGVILYGEYENGKLCDIGDLPQKPKAKHISPPVGLCLSEDQVNALANVVGFKSPVRSK